MTVVPLKLVEEPEERARKLARTYAEATALDILRAAITEEFPGRIAAVSSFGAESAVLLELVAEIDPHTPVIFLDTGKHFAPTLSYRKKIAARLGLTNVIDIHPDQTDLTTADPNGNLWQSDADQCCTLRKVRPLDKALEGFDAWITGRKQFHGGQRLRLPAFEHSGKHYKVNPIVHWTPERIQEHFKEKNLPAHPLVAQGFPSIGCWPCTHPVAEGGDVRDGRWRGAAKTECGIHAR